MARHAPPLRYAPEIPFPSYAFVPGKHPHPVTDPNGHSYGATRSIPEPLDPRHPEKSRTFLNGIDLFNAGFYWEAHEAWEELWISAGRGGELASFLKGLIKLAAAGVKMREGTIAGVKRHGSRAMELFQALRADGHHFYCGMEVATLICNAREFAERPMIDDTTLSGDRFAIPFYLTLSARFKNPEIHTDSSRRELFAGDPDCELGNDCV